jgi:hypothetical protein
LEQFQKEAKDQWDNKHKKCKQKEADTPLPLATCMSYGPWTTSKRHRNRRLPLDYLQDCKTLPS